MKSDTCKVIEFVVVLYTNEKTDLTVHSFTHSLAFLEICPRISIIEKLENGVFLM